MGNKAYGQQGRDVAPAAGQSTSAMAIVGLVLGILALLGSWVPIFNNFVFFIGLIGLVFSIVGLIATSKGKKSGKGLAIAAVVLNVLACIFVLATQSFYSSILSG